jgi:hypothetical protein
MADRIILTGKDAEPEDKTVTTTETTVSAPVVQKEIVVTKKTTVEKSDD